MHSKLCDLRHYFDKDVLETYAGLQPAARQWWSKGARGTIKISSDLFNAWAATEIEAIEEENDDVWAERNTYQGFESWHNELAQRWSDYAQAHGPSPAIAYRTSGVAFIDDYLAAEKSKVARKYYWLDEWIMHLGLRSSNGSSRKQAIEAYGHIRLDTKSILAISQALKGIALDNPNANMVRTEHAYRTYQRLARAICAHAGGSPILFHHFAQSGDVSRIDAKTSFTSTAPDPANLFDLDAYMNSDWLDKYQQSLLDPDIQAWWTDPGKEKTQYGVETSTIRAMSRGKVEAKTNGPLKVYNDWAKGQLRNNEILSAPSRHNELTDAESFEAWHGRLRDSLVEAWETCTPETSERVVLKLEHQYKLVDLFVRDLRTKFPADSLVRQAIDRHAHIPLDMKSLAVISATFGDIALCRAGSATDKRTGGRTVSTLMAMGSVKTEAQYRLYQDLARVICLKKGGSPVLLDVFAWQSEEAKPLYAKHQVDDLVMQAGDVTQSLRACA